MPHMSLVDSNLASTPVRPGTPPASPTINVVQPTPSPHGRFRTSNPQSSDISEEGDYKASPADNGDGMKKGHTRTVSFGAEVDIGDAPVFKMERSLSAQESQDRDTGGTGKYQVPQRRFSNALEEHSTLVSTVHPPTFSGRRKAAPRPLSFQAPTRTSLDSLVSPLSGSTGLPTGPSLSARLGEGVLTLGSGGPHRTTNRHSTIGLPGAQSIWSAGGNTSIGAGWISPALGSARSTGTAARQRGLSVAVLTDEGEILAEAPASASGLARPLKSPTTAPALHSAKVDSAKPDGKPKEIILCRYYHTPGLTCTSRPCRFVHSLDGIVPPSATLPKDGHYRMLSPTAVPDPTGGIFAQAQMRPRASEDELETLRDAAPGEVVALPSAKGEVLGQVLLMSGGGKGPAGKSRAKYKTVKCKDYAAGYCQYGEYCSFIHAEEAPAMERSSSEQTMPNDVVERRLSLPSQTTSQLPPPTSALTRHLSLVGDDCLSPSSILSRVTTPVTRSRQPSPKPALLDPVAFDSNYKPTSSPKLHERADHTHTTELSAAAAPFQKSSVKSGNSEYLNMGPAILAPRSPNTPDSSFVTAAVPKSSAWSKGPPKSLKKVTIHTEVPETPTGLRPPPTAFSLFGTDSDPATPWDPAVRYQKAKEAETIEPVNPEYSSSVFEAPPAFPSPGEWGLVAPTYPWGMPMSPVFPPGSQADVPKIPGGLGVMWTPAGWAVQDAAMKSSLRYAELKTTHPEIKTRGKKNFFRKRPCKFFAEGYCPHGDKCTYQHILPTGPSPARRSSNSSEAKEAPRPHPKHRTIPCKFFNSAEGCISGDACDFLHTFVLPAEAPIVDKPRPWRTRPCRHFQMGTCRLGDACHFAHVVDPTFKDDRPCRQWAQTGRCDAGSRCRFRHVEVGGTERLTEERLRQTYEEVRRARLHGEEDQDRDESDDEDDVEIVTEDTSNWSNSRASSMPPVMC